METSPSTSLLRCVLVIRHSRCVTPDSSLAEYPIETVDTPSRGLASIVENVIWLAILFLDVLPMGEC